jgi:hypothetical protein
MCYTQRQYDDYREDYEEFLSKYNDLKAYIQSLQDNVPDDLHNVFEEVLAYYEYYNAECRKAGVKSEINHEDLAGVTNRYQKLTESIRGDVTIFRLLIINPDWDYKYELEALDKVYSNLIDKYKTFLNNIQISEGE